MTATPSTGELLAVIGNLYDAAVEPAKWPDALAEIARMFDGEQVVLSCHDLKAGTLELQARYNSDPVFERLMAENFAENPFNTAALYLEVGVPHSANRIFDFEDLRRSRWHQRTMGAYGMGDAAMTITDRNAGRFGALSVMRREQQPWFAPDELAALGIVTPHLRRAVTIAGILDARAEERATLSGALDLVNAGVVLTDASGRIVHVNSAAARHLDAGLALTRNGDQIAAREAAEAQDLAAAIASAASGTTIDIPRAGISVALRAAAGGRDLAAWVLPLDSRLRRDFGGGFDAQVAVFVRELGDTSPFPAELFVRRYGITPAECRVLMAIVQGMNPAEASDALGLSLPTIKTHLARLFDKTGTRGQPDLIRLAMSALAPASAV